MFKLKIHSTKSSTAEIDRWLFDMISPCGAIKNIRTNHKMHSKIIENCLHDSVIKVCQAFKWVSVSLYHGKI